MMKLIGVSGKKRSGKDTFYQFLANNPSLTVHRVAFADALKAEVYERILQPDGLARDLMENDDTKERFRTLMQWWGTEYRRQLFRDDYWLVQLANTLEQWKDDDCIVVVTDVRFPNEFEFIRSRGGLNVRIERPGLDVTGAAGAHPSETALDGETRFDTVLVNNGDLALFEQLVDMYSSQLSQGVQVPRIASVA
ncbi:MAG: hypothetical protein JSS66_07605 [Armatimonadetes bacterium]|nr:hypothetical protein [Armatimonadota bacterium]